MTGRGSGGWHRRHPPAGRPRSGDGRTSAHGRGARRSLRDPAPRRPRQRPGRAPCGCRARRQARRRAAALLRRTQRARSRADVPTLDRDDTQGAQHFRVDDLDDGFRIDAAERALGGGGIELEPAGETRRQAAQQEVGVGHGPRRTAACVARRAGVRPGALRADAQGAAIALQTTDPPPAPTVWMSTIGIRTESRPLRDRRCARPALPR